MSTKEKWEEVKKLLEEIKKDGGLHEENEVIRILYIVDKFV